MTTVAERYDMFVNGRKCQAKSGKVHEILNPANNEVIAEIPAAGEADVNEAVASATAANDAGEWRSMGAAERGDVLLRAADIIEARADEFIKVETTDVAKPIIESTTFDIPMAVDHLRYYGKLVVDLPGQTIPAMGGVLDYTVREPIGVVAGIIPWNFPLVLACRKLAPALAGGNCVVLKPPLWAPLTSLMMADVLVEAGLPENVLQIVSGGRETGRLVAEHPAIRMLSFTGSTATGCAVMQSASRGLRGVGLELGGKSPAVVLADADMEQAVEGIIFGAFLNQGECCCGATRVCIDRSIHAEFRDRLVARCQEIVVGDPFDKNTKMGALIHPEHFDKVTGYIKQGIADGAKLLLGGPDKPAGLEAGNFVPITVFDEVDPSLTIYRDEIFGPVLTITPFDGFDALIDAANDTDYGLAASVWTTSLQAGHAAANAIHAGTVWLNCHNFVFSSAPYGGYKQSGIGKELGREGLYAYMEEKNVIAWLGEDPFTWY